MTAGEAIAIAGVVLTGLVQFAALVWFAATMRAELRETRKDVSEIKGDVRGFSVEHNRLEGRVIMLESGKTAVL